MYKFRDYSGNEDDGYNKREDDEYENYYDDQLIQDNTKDYILGNDEDDKINRNKDEQTDKYIRVDGNDYEHSKKIEEDRIPINKKIETLEKKMVDFLSNIYQSSEKEMDNTFPSELKKSLLTATKILSQSNYTKSSLTEENVDTITPNPKEDGTSSKATETWLRGFNKIKGLIPPKKKTETQLPDRLEKLEEFLENTDTSDFNRLTSSNASVYEPAPAPDPNIRSRTMARTGNRTRSGSRTGNRTRSGSRTGNITRTGPSIQPNTPKQSDFLNTPLYSAEDKSWKDEAAATSKHSSNSYELAKPPIYGSSVFYGNKFNKPKTP